MATFCLKSSNGNIYEIKYQISSNEEGRISDLYYNFIIFFFFKSKPK